MKYLAKTLALIMVLVLAFIQTAYAKGEGDITNHLSNCPVCGQEITHEASEWVYDAESGRDVQLCPNCGYQVNKRDHVHAYTIWTEGDDSDVAKCICGEAFAGFTQRKVNLDLQYNSETLEITPNMEKAVEIEFGMFGDISNVTVAMLAYKGSNIPMHNRDGKDINSSFIEGTLTINIAEFGFAYGDRELAITFMDAGGTERVVNMPVLLVTKVIMDKTDLDNMKYFSKESEASEELIYGGYFEMGTDISYNQEFNYVMPPNIAAQSGGFVGVFDGCGYNIDGIEINRATRGYTNKWDNFYGIFGSMYGGTIKNVSFTNVVMCVKGSLISAYGAGTIENVYASFKQIDYNNPVGFAFSQGVGGGTTIKNCIVDVSNATFAVVSGASEPYKFYFFGKKGVTAPNLQGVYLIGELPSNTEFWKDENIKTGEFGKYDSMKAFAEAYNKGNSELKAEIDTWDKTYWQITDGSISFR